MGIFNRKKNSTSSTSATPTKEEKAIYEYKMMEQVDCDLDAAIQNPNPGFMDYCKLIAESSDYLFYSYKAFKDNSGGYVIRRSKANPAQKLFFGENYQLSCVFKDYLFQCGHSGERGRFFIYAKNIFTGNVQKCDWLGKGDIFVVINGFGRFYVQDTINTVSVQNETLVFDVTRKKSSRTENTDKYDIDTDYSLKVTIENGQFKPIAFFNIEPEMPISSEKSTQGEAKKEEVGHISNNSVASALGRDESKHISCQYVGHENDCPKDCEKCAISIKTDGDVFLASNRLNDAIKQYKKALFVEPKFAEAWCNLANAYGMKSEYNNALSAFNKALAIDPQYGKAMFGKAVTLRNLGELDAAMKLANNILELYDDLNVHNFKEKLASAGVKDTAAIYSLQEAIDTMTDIAYEIIVSNNLLAKDGQIHTIREIDSKVDFARRIYAFCKRRYSSLGDKKVWSESILAAFYGSAYVVLKYYLNPNEFNNVNPFDYLSNNVNLEELDRNTERILGIREDDKQSEKVWNIIYSFVTASTPILEGVEPTSDLDAAVMDASESAYVMGMLLAMRHHETISISNNQQQVSSEILIRLDRLKEEIEQLSTMMGYGYGQQEIIDAAKGTGYTPEEYRERLHESFYQKQREYNGLIDQYHLSDKRKKYIIDSFSDMYGKLSLLDPVEIDLQKRLASDSLFSKCRLLTQDKKYRFYSCDYAMLREDINKGIVVYFGHSASPACVYHDKLYWYEHGSILSDKFIYRCNVVDGQNMEKYDWLSNEKTGEVMGHSYHIVSEDRVTSMIVQDDALVINVQRKSIKDAQYNLKIRDDGQRLQISKHIISGDFSECKDYSSFTLR
jgi:tetratricopeptide (TPR) repeat protein